MVNSLVYRKHKGTKSNLIGTLTHLWFYFVQRLIAIRITTFTSFFFSHTVLRLSIYKHQLFPFVFGILFASV